MLGQLGSAMSSVLAVAYTLPFGTACGRGSDYGVGFADTQTEFLTSALALPRRPLSFSFDGGLRFALFALGWQWLWPLRSALSFGCLLSLWLQLSSVNLSSFDADCGFLTIAGSPLGYGLSLSWLRLASGYGHDFSIGSGIGHASDCGCGVGNDLRMAQAGLQRGPPPSVGHGLVSASRLPNYDFAISRDLTGG